MPRALGRNPSGAGTEHIGFYATFAATANDAANIQIPRSGRLVGIQIAATADLDATDETANMELSFIPVFQSNQHNTRNLIAAVRLRAGLVTAESPLMAVNVFYPLDIPVSPLQILYINGVLSGSGGAVFAGILYLR